MARRADVAVVLDVYPAREHASDYPGVDGSLVAAAAAEQASGRQVAWLPGFDEARSFLDVADSLAVLVPGIWESRKQGRFEIVHLVATRLGISSAMRRYSAAVSSRRLRIRL